MAWRIVKQPNGKYARWADPIDNFTHLNMTRGNALRLCHDEIGREQGDKKVWNADHAPHRWQEALEKIELIHGAAVRQRVQDEVPNPPPPPPTDPKKMMLGGDLKSDMILRHARAFAHCNPLPENEEEVVYLLCEFGRESSGALEKMLDRALGIQRDMQNLSLAPIIVRREDVPFG